MIFGINFLKTQLAIHFVLPVKYKFHKNIEIYFKNFINNNNYVLLEEPSYILQFDGPKKVKNNGNDSAIFSSYLERFVLPI